jgi:hypothetical protein
LISSDVYQRFQIFSTRSQLKPTATVEDEDISDVTTVTTLVRNGPRPANSRFQLTLMFLFQSSQELSPRNVAGPCLQLNDAIAKLKTTLPHIFLDQHGNPITTYSHDLLSNFNQYLPTATTPAKTTQKKITNQWT